MTVDEIKKLKKDLGIGQQRLAHLTGIERWEIQQFESGYRPLDETKLSKIIFCLKIESKKRLKEIRELMSNE